MCISINIRTNVAFFLCLRLCTSKVPLLVLMLISSCEPGFTASCKAKGKINEHRNINLTCATMIAKTEANVFARSEMD